MSEQLKQAEILRLRLRNQWLTGSNAKRPEEIVGHFGAVQAQDFGMAKWAIGLRGTELTETKVAAAFDAGEILRTHVLRPTWHFVLPADIRGLLRLSAPRVRALMAYNDREHGVDAALLRTADKVLIRALRGGKHLTRDELGAELARAGIKLTGGGLAHVMIHAELGELVCSGPRRGKQFTYALLDERAPDGRVPDRDAALAMLAQRYFQSHGPATAQDFAWWSGLALRDARNGIESLGSTFARATHEGREYFFPTTTRTTAMRDALLLPNYDEYLVAYTERELMIGRGFPTRNGLRDDPIFKNTIVMSGVVIGTWQRTLSANSARVLPKTFVTPSPAMRKVIERATKRYQTFACG